MSRVLMTGNAAAAWGARLARADYMPVFPITPQTEIIETLGRWIDRGEMDARMVGYSSVKTAQPDWLKKDTPVNILMQFATRERLPEFPDVPTAQELVTNEEDRALITMLETPFFMARPFAGPPAIPADRVKALRSAFMATHEDARYKNEAQKLRLLVSASSGEEVFDEIRRLRPGVPIVLVSGYSRNSVSDRFAGRDLAGFLQKPFLPDTLLLMVRKTLGD